MPLCAASLTGAVSASRRLLSGYSLSGTLPTELAQLSHLTSMCALALPKILDVSPRATRGISKDGWGFGQHRYEPGWLRGVEKVRLHLSEVWGLM